MRILKSKIFKYLVILTILLSPLFAWTNRWWIHDYLRLRNYQPPKKIIQLADDTTMHESSRKIFYAYHPELNDKELFNTNCNTSEKTIILGCYVSGLGIYLFDVTDDRLAGILQVTAAHELLHASYDRLSSSEKSRIDELMLENFAKVTDKRILETINEYRSNGADINNELHSILATEVRNLTPELETYYKKYFSNRIKIVEYSEKYEKEFSDRKSKIDEYDQLLNTNKEAIEALQTQLISKQSELQTDRAKLDSLLAKKDYSAYNAGVNDYNAGVNSYNNLVKQIRSLIEKYNSLVAERNNIAKEQGQLVKAIDSRPEAITAQ